MYHNWRRSRSDAKPAILWWKAQNGHVTIKNFSGELIRRISQYRYVRPQQKYGVWDGKFFKLWFCVNSCLYCMKSAETYKNYIIIRTKLFLRIDYVTNLSAQEKYSRIGNFKLLFIGFQCIFSLLRCFTIKRCNRFVRSNCPQLHNEYLIEDKRVVHFEGTVKRLWRCAFAILLSPIGAITNSSGAPRVFWQHTSLTRECALQFRLFKHSHNADYPVFRFVTKGRHLQVADTICSGMFFGICFAMVFNRCIRWRNLLINASLGTRF